MSNLNDIMVYAFRYALGRSTYVVGDVCDFIIEHIDELERKGLSVIKREIEDYLERSKYGVLIFKQDKDNWEKLLKKVKETLDNR